MFVSKVTFPAPTEQDENNKFRKWFVIDYDTLEVRSQDDDPGGTLQVPYLVPNASAAPCRFWSLGPVIETIDVHAEDTGDRTFPMKRRDLYRKSLGEADAGDYYRLRHEVWWSANWYEYHGDGGPVRALRAAHPVRQGRAIVALKLRLLSRSKPETLSGAEESRA